MKVNKSTSFCLTSLTGLTSLTVADEAGKNTY